MIEANVLQEPALKYREDLIFLTEQFFLIINNYKVALKQVYLEEDVDNDKKHNLEQIRGQLSEIYRDVMILSGNIIDSIVKEKEKIEELDNRIADLKLKFNAENKSLNDILSKGNAANPMRLDARKEMRKSYYMEIFYAVAITCGGGYLYSYFKNR